MKIIALEEHIAPRLVTEAWAKTADRQDISVTINRGGQAERLEDLGDLRLAEMDDGGVDVQVLSLPPPALHNFDPAEAVPLAKDVNDLLAAAVAYRPDRFEGFATLPVRDPVGSARELDRAVTRLGLKGAMLCGRVGDRHLDDRAFDPIYQGAERLRAPLYIHPQTPPPAVLDAYYKGFNPVADFMFATAGIGWHYEAGLEFLRMVMGGVFDRFPKLQVILGHWGEVVLFYLDRIAMLGGGVANLRLERPIKDYFRQNAFYTPSGIFSQTYLKWTIEAVGVDRLMFSQDYPYQIARGGEARAFLERSELSDADKARIAHGNWEALTSHIHAS